MAHTQPFAVSLSSEAYWLEAGDPENVLIESNLLTSIGCDADRYGVVIKATARGPAGPQRPARSMTSGSSATRSKTAERRWS